jgi:hypothetical protein
MIKFPQLSRVNRFAIEQKKQKPTSAEMGKINNSYPELDSSI